MTIPDSHPGKIEDCSGRRFFVYYLFDADDRPLYVGMTRKPEKRWKEHQRNKPEMVARVARKRMAGPYDYQTALNIEYSAQFDLEPMYCGVTKLRHKRRIRDAARWGHEPPPPPWWEGLA